MKRISTIIALSILSIATLIGCGKKQKIIFEVESIFFESEWSKPDVQKECSILDERLSSHINNGWKVVTASPKEKVVHRIEDSGYKKEVRESIGRCIGTEYILEK